MDEQEQFLAKQYLAYEAGTIPWIQFLETIIPVFTDAGRIDEAQLFQEFALIIQSTSYPEEKASYQSVEIHCDYSTAIDSARAKL